MTETGHPAKRRFWSVLTLVAYIFCIALPVWYNSVRIPRVALPRDEIEALAAAVSEPLAAALSSTITVYVVCPGPGYSCLEYRQLSDFAQQLGLAVLEQAGMRGEQAPLVVRVLHDAPDSCSASSWVAPGEAARRVAAAAKGPLGGGPASAVSGGGGGTDGGSGCLDLVTSPDLHRIVMGGQDRDFDDWAAGQLAGQDRPGNYHLFVVPDPWLGPSELPYGSVGRRRVAFVRHPPALGPTHGSVIRLAALLAAPAFASQLGAPLPAGTPSSPTPEIPDTDTNPDSETSRQPLPISATAQLHLSFSLCNAQPSPNHHDGGDRGASIAPAAAAAFTWSFPQFEAQFVAPLKRVLSPAARLTASSQVLYFTPARVNGNWDEHRGAFVLPYAQLPFFVDSSWPLDPGRTGLPTSAAGDGGVPYDVAAVTVGSRRVTVGEAMTMPQAGAPGAATGAAAAAAAMPHLLPPPAAAALPPAVLHFVLYAPPPHQRPLVFLGPDGSPAPANSFRVPGWGMLQVLNQVPEPDLISAQVGAEAMEAFAVELVSQLRALLGLGPARRRLLRLVQASANTSAAAGAAGASAVGRVTVLSALRTGLAPWEVDALVRRRVREDAAGAAATLAALARLLRQVPTLAVPAHVGAHVRQAVAALWRTLRLAAQGRYEEASRRSAQETRSYSEAAFSDPALSSRLNVPDTHLVGVYLPFCLPAVVPLLQALLQEFRQQRRRRKEGENVRRRSCTGRPEAATAAEAGPTQGSGGKAPPRQEAAAAGDTATVAAEVENKAKDGSGDEGGSTLRPARRTVRVMAYATDVPEEAYACVGLAQCFRKTGGGLEPVLVIEPLSASSLECLANGARTSYKMVTGVSFGDAMNRNRDVLPDAFRDAPFCENYEFRCEAAARTWQRPHAQDNLMDIVPLGKARSNFNFSLEDKRILNMDNVVNDSDNIKQDMSIDVYGRKKADDLKAKQATEAAAAKAAEEAKATKKQKEEDDLDALLLA
ncbi:hypothetical protein VOLCADRAFT_107210 [Volvox carteri f. nagariensis]|uniref:Uncharacterized protein n=1 Tax=Volvox carteri f. nagariensis TaxID=3068 RepID=D8UCL8_VOLCA|nr:uncharacterized protein VOLCADRAFT_107210 [Volvox carteri f. nagariensis]EFJ42574.1 hypothetical protein VOLCADRAFT_107210 [Volvox carteri f. nagariensis]|eukprot:XP_002956430.1 hypothetical protein VOLCADRAFT_107210 [Volvox carteri f. nagariensis]